MICPLMSGPSGNLPDEKQRNECLREHCALWAYEVKGKSIAGCSILVGAGSLIAIAAMLEKNLAK